MFWSVTVAVVFTPPGKTVERFSTFAQFGFTLTRPAAEKQTVPVFTWSLIVSVPDAIALPLFDVSALKDANVPLKPR